jgi:sugar-phosphatase
VAPDRCVLTVGAVLFDMDGVLVDSTSMVERIWRAFAQRHDLDPEAVLHDLHGRRMRDLVRSHLPEATDDEVEVEVARIEQAEVDGAGEVRALPGAFALTAALDGHPWAIVTSGNRRAAEARAAAAGFRPPDQFLTAEDVVRGKPAPDPYLQAAAGLGVDPRGAVVFEDAPAGIAAANAAGCTSVGLLTSHTAAELRSADHLIRDLSCVHPPGSTEVAAGAAGLLLRLDCER